MSRVFLRNHPVTGAEAARRLIADLACPDPGGEWYWNVWQSRQPPFNEFHEGALVGLVVSWAGHHELAYLCRAVDVLVGEHDGWEAATKAIAARTGLPTWVVRSEPYTADKRAGDGGKVIVWRAEVLRTIGAELPGLAFGRNGWAAVEHDELFGDLDGPDSEADRGGHSRGAGFLMEAEVRRVVERRAVAVVQDWCTKNDWTDVRDVGATESYDLVGAGDGVERRIEVKGTTGGPGAVTVTRREVEVATGDKNHLMVIVHGIATALDESGALVADGGQIVVHDPWLPTDGELTPINFRWERAGR